MRRQGLGAEASPAGFGRAAGGNVLELAVHPADSRCDGYGVADQSEENSASWQEHKADGPGRGESNEPWFHRGYARGRLVVGSAERESLRLDEPSMGEQLSHEVRPEGLWGVERGIGIPCGVGVAG